MDPQQELFTALLLKLKEKYEDTGIGVYDTFLPPDGTPYPFIYLADSTQDDQANKTTVFGAVSQVIHVWHNNQRYLLQDRRNKEFWLGSCKSESKSPLRRNNKRTPNAWGFRIRIYI